jgi:hypothetical protein
MTDVTVILICIMTDVTVISICIMTDVTVISKYFLHCVYPCPYLTRKRNIEPSAELYYTQSVDLIFVVNSPSWWLYFDNIPIYIYMYMLFYQRPHKQHYLFNPLKHSGNSMHHLLQHSKTLHSAHTVIVALSSIIPL